MASPRTDQAICPICGMRNIRIEYSHADPRLYRIVCAWCGYATPEAANLNDCATHMQWQARQPCANA